MECIGHLTFFFLFFFFSTRKSVVAVVVFGIRVAVPACVVGWLAVVVVVVVVRNRSKASICGSETLAAATGGVTNVRAPPASRLSEKSK